MPQFKELLAYMTKEQHSRFLHQILANSIEQKNSDITEYLLHSGEYSRRLLNSSDYGTHPLVIAQQSDNENAIVLLKQAGAFLDVPDKNNPWYLPNSSTKGLRSSRKSPTV